MENELGLVFVVVFPALLPLTYTPSLLSRVKQLFLALFGPYIRELVESLANGSVSESALTLLKQKIKEEKWDQIFDRCLRSCEEEGDKRKPVSLQKQAQVMSAASTTSSEQPFATLSYNTIILMSGPGPDESITAEEIAKNVAQLKSRMRRGKGKTPSPTPSPNKPASKLMRKWNDSAVSEADMAALDYSAPADMSAPVDTTGLVSTGAMGTRAANGLYEVAEWDYRPEQLPSEDEILAKATSGLGLGSAAKPEESESRLGGLFSRLTGKKTLTKADLQPVLVDMEKHLMAKNVAKDIAEKLCESVGAALVGKKLGGLTSIKSEVENALSASLTRVLTPKSSTDILLEIQRKRQGTLADALPDPYAMTFVGVNGVGKSTNLSKVSFWLLQNGLRVLIAACDTFRSGAVEQLRVHVRNLGALSEEMGMEKRIELYERGYGKDAAGIAKDAIAYGAFSLKMM